MKPGDLVIVERKRRWGPPGNEPTGDIALLLKIDHDTASEGYESMALVLHDDGTLDWQWLGNITPVDEVPP